MTRNVLGRLLDTCSSDRRADTVWCSPLPRASGASVKWRGSASINTVAAQALATQHHRLHAHPTACAPEPQTRAGRGLLVGPWVATSVEWLERGDIARARFKRAVSAAIDQPLVKRWAR
jgi:hypothetical protein